MADWVHVLLVEDEPLVALVTAQALRQVPAVAEVTIAVDGEDALTLLRSGAVRPEHLVILTDLSMPRMSGLELVAAVKQIPALRGKPIAVLTTSTDPADREAALALHVAAYFDKGGGRSYLEALVSWLRGYAATLAPSPGTFPRLAPA